jgi:hypothetical protein
MKRQKANDLKSLHASLLVTLALNGINPNILRGPKLWHRGAGRGQTMPMVATVAFLLVVVGVGIFFLIQFFGGSKEIQNAVDGGTLQVAKRALWAPRVQLTHSNPTTGLDEVIEFSGVAKKVKEIELTNFPGSVPPDDGNFYIDLQGINGVWGLALLEALNVQRMQQQGLATPTAVTHARQIQQTAADISKRLAQALINDSDQTQAEPGVTNPLHKKFHQLANVNTVRMMNWQTGEAIREDDYHNSYTYRGKDSNIQYDTEQTTIGLLALNNISTQPLNGKFLRGYIPCSVPLTGGPALNFMFVPLDHEKKPHLISETRYGPDKVCSNIASPITTANPPEIPPNAFHFSALAKVEKATKDMELRAFAASQDMTSGLVLQNVRGFIRIENMPGVSESGGAGNLHVIEASNRQIVSEYSRNMNQGLSSQEANTVMGRSLFNPVENRWGDNSYAMEGNGIMSIACFALGILGINIAAAGICTIICLLSMAFMACFKPCYWAMCAIQIICVFALNCEVPSYDVGSFMNPFNPGFKPMYGYLPAMSSPGAGITHYGGPNPSDVCRVTPENEGKHKCFYDWLGGDYSIDTTGLMFSFVTAPCSLCFWTDHGEGSWRPTLNFTADQYESGMKDRNPEDARRVSLLNGGQNGPFTTDGTLRTLLFNRTSDPNVKFVYDLLFQRMREMSPQSPASEIEAILSSTKHIPMGAMAYIFLDDSNRFQLAVQPSNSPGDPLPSWLTPIKLEVPDGIDRSFEYREQATNKDRNYRLVDPNADWGGELNAAVAAKYPTRISSFDKYHFLPSSGFHGLLGVLKLGSRVEKLCARQGVVSAGASTWSQPQDCFCFSPMGSRENNGNCGSSL